jgi:cysteine desulfurase
VTVFLDHAAGTRLRPEALDAMLPWLADRPGNPSSAHAPGRAARLALDEARDAVAELVGAEPGGVVFTSGGTEAADLAVRGTLGLVGGHAVAAAVEHAAVLAPVRAAAGSTVGVDATGVVRPEVLAAHLDRHPDTTLVSVQAANNETGVLQPVAALVEVVRERAPGARVHTDAVQAAPWLDLPALVGDADLVGVSSHKLGGPRGAGALVRRGDADVAPVLLGGGQEWGRRAGTVDVAAVVGFGAAVRTVLADREATSARVVRLRDRLGAGLTAIDGVTPTAAGAPKLPGIVHVCVAGVEREELVLLADRAGVALSAGSACASGALEPSHVLVAMGLEPTRSAGALRASLGWDSTEADVDRAVAVVADVVARLRRAAA